MGHFPIRPWTVTRHVPAYLLLFESLSARLIFLFSVASRLAIFSLEKKPTTQRPAFPRFCNWFLSPLHLPGSPSSAAHLAEGISCCLQPPLGLLEERRSPSHFCSMCLCHETEFYLSITFGEGKGTSAFAFLTVSFGNNKMPNPFRQSSKGKIQN